MQRGLGGLLCELCVGIKGLMKCLLQARGDRHWGEGRESGCHKGGGVEEGLTGGPRPECDHFIPNTVLHEGNIVGNFQSRQQHFSLALLTGVRRQC